MEVVAVDGLPIVRCILVDCTVNPILKVVLWILSDAPISTNILAQPKLLAVDGTVTVLGDLIRILSDRFGIQAQSQVVLAFQLPVAIDFISVGMVLSITVNGVELPFVNTSPVVRVAVIIIPVSAMLYLIPVMVTLFEPAGIVPDNTPDNTPVPVFSDNDTVVAVATFCAVPVLSWAWMVAEKLVLIFGDIGVRYAIANWVGGTISATIPETLTVGVVAIPPPLWVIVPV